MLVARDQVHSRRESEAISEEDFISMYAAHHIGKLNPKTDEAELRVAFDSLDINNDGFVTAEDLHTSCGFMTPKTCQDIARESADAKDESRISFPAFIKAMRNTPSYSNPATPKLRSLRSGRWSSRGSPISQPITPPMIGAGGDKKIGTHGFSTANVVAGYQAPQLGGHSSSLSSIQAPKLGVARGGEEAKRVDPLKQPLLGEE
mmetsp:Transcript_7113/g.13265  ORF Transcript_7113/g.13265 Transcript_7113/m.13265 type:complete len:204 (+) Transcript_7113:1211-1822(+)